MKKINIVMNRLFAKQLSTQETSMKLEFLVSPKMNILKNYRLFALPAFRKIHCGDWTSRIHAHTGKGFAIRKRREQPWLFPPG